MIFCDNIEHVISLHITKRWQYTDTAHCKYFSMAINNIEILPNPNFEHKDLYMNFWLLVRI